MLSFFKRHTFAVVSACVFFFLILFFLAAAPINFPAGTTITVAPGETLKSLATELKEKHYIRSRVFFLNLITLARRQRGLAPGDYYFAYPQWSVGMAWQIATGRHDVLPVKITVPEGETVSDLAILLSQKLPILDKASFLNDAVPYEGYLFPETYFIYLHTAPEDIVGQMRAMFQRETKNAFSSDIVIMASILEKEAHGDEDRATISGILWNRIKQGIPLGVDAAPGTYSHTGLPKAPISNPGLAALDAALHPAVTPYLYYLHDSHGTIHYARTFAEHKANIAKYLR